MYGEWCMVGDSIQQAQVRAGASRVVGSEHAEFGALRRPHLPLAFGAFAWSRLWCCAGRRAAAVRVERWREGGKDVRGGLNVDRQPVGLSRELVPLAGLRGGGGGGAVARGGCVQASAGGASRRAQLVNVPHLSFVGASRLSRSLARSCCASAGVGRT